MKSAWQMDQPDNSQRSGTRIKQEETGSPASSDMSMDKPGHFQRSLALSHKNKPEEGASPASSHVSVKSEWSMDTPGNFQGSVALSPRIELEQGASPLSTHESLKSDWSVDQHSNVQGGDPPTLHITQLEVLSPVPSLLSLKSDKSMERPDNFRNGHSPLRFKQDKKTSPVPSYLSMKSYQSMDLPLHFRSGNSPFSLKQERSDSDSASSCTSLMSMEPPRNTRGEFTPRDSRELTASLLTKDHFTCSVCTDVLKDPVSIPCGHSFCRQCITSYWDQPNHAGHYACPQCSQTQRPPLYTNSALAEVVQKLQQFSPVQSSPPDHCSAGPGDVACDFCTGRKLRAMKSCLTCMASYCESHVRNHYTAPALQTHKLIETTESLDQMICQEHNRALELFCKTDKIFICCMCAVEGHKDHTIKIEDPTKGASETAPAKREKNLKLLKESSIVDMKVGKMRRDLKTGINESKSEFQARNKWMKQESTRLKAKITKLKREKRNTQREKTGLMKENTKLKTENLRLRKIHSQKEKRITEVGQGGFQWHDINREGENYMSQTEEEMYGLASIMETRSKGTGYIVQGFTTPEFHPITPATQLVPEINVHDYLEYE